MKLFTLYQTFNSQVQVEHLYIVRKVKNQNKYLSVYLIDDLFTDIDDEGDPKQLYLSWTENTGGKICTTR